MNDEKRRKAMIAAVMDGFEFVEVSRVMQYLDRTWTWSGPNGHVESGVPSIYRLMTMAEDLLDQVTKADGEDYCDVACGGFRAVRYETGDIELRFEIEESAAYVDDYKKK